MLLENLLITCVKQHGRLPNDKPSQSGDKASKTGGDVNKNMLPKEIMSMAKIAFLLL